MKKKLIIIPTELFKKIKKAAEASERSVNKQIIFLLKEGLSKQEKKK